MTTPSTVRFALGLLLVALMGSGASHARAAGESVQITGVSPVGAITPGTMVSFSALASNFVDPVYTFSDLFSAAGATTGTIDKIGYFSWTPGVYDAGTHTITVTVSDAYHHAASTTINIIVASNTVIINSLSPGPIVAVHRPITFSINAPGFTTPNYAIYDSGMGSVSSGNVNSVGAFSWTPTNDDIGTHTLTVRASDLYGRSAQATQTITVINPTLSLQSLQPGSAAGVGSTVSFVANANMLKSPTYGVSDSFTGTSTITAVAMSPIGVFTWKPAAADLGMHTITVTAADATGNTASSTLMILITAAPATPSAPVQSATSGTTTVITDTTIPYLFTTYLSIGSHGTAVTELQKRLIALGFLTGQATGYFGTMTAAGVKRFQRAHALRPVGFVGPGTRAVLNKK